MNILDYAMQMEKDGEAYYRDLAAKTDNKGLKNILTMLADVEVTHYKLFHEMKEKGSAEATESDIIEKVKNIFVKMKEEQGATGLDISEADLYRKAQELEKQSREFYLSKAEAAGGEEQRKVFLEIAEEEKRHYHILQNIIDFVSRPEQWLEDAEWYHLEDY